MTGLVAATLPENLKYSVFLYRDEEHVQSAGDCGNRGAVLGRALCFCSIGWLYWLLETNKDLGRGPVRTEINGMVLVNIIKSRFGYLLDLWIGLYLVLIMSFTQNRVSVILHLIDWIAARMCSGTPVVPSLGSRKANTWFNSKLMGIFLLSKRWFG